MNPAADDFRILSPTAILGYGFPEASFLRGMELHPDLVAVDAGSADPGPYYLGAGVSFTDRAAVKRDLRFMIRHAREHDIPIVVGSCGGSGAAPHLQWTRSIVEEILEEDEIAARLGLIGADIDPGLAIHLGKILECVAIAADPGSGADSVMGILHRDSFELVPLCEDRRFTAASVAAHSLYEKSDPVKLPGPGGCLDLSEVTFSEEAGGRVRVSGSRFLATEDFRVKLEGARRVGFRTVSVAGIRDPIMIDTIDSILTAVKARVTASTLEEGVGGSLHFHVYGRNGVMGAREPVTDPASHELGIVIEGIAPTQKEADTICSLARSTLLHYGYPGRIATAGNLAFPFSPSDMKAGAVYEFSLYHLMALNDQTAFPLEVVDR